MLISAVNTTRPSFGYDKKLNAELKEELNASTDKRWADSMLTLNSYCNKLESNLKAEEKSVNDDNKSVYSDYVDMFALSKTMLTGYAQIYFENLHFADREYEHYGKEFVKNGSKDNDWRKTICKELAQWVSDDVELIPGTEPKSIETVNQTPKKEAPEDIDETPQADPELAKTISSLSKNSFLEQFIPDDTTPKGFKDVAGMDKLKKDFQNGIIQLIKDPQQAQLDFEDYGKKIPKALLLYGPPGCGKTYIAQALASEIDAPLYMLNISKAGSHYVNMTSKNIKAAFDEAAKIAAQSEKPCLLFMDEVDSLSFNRGAKTEPEQLKQVATMLQGMDNARKSNVIIIGATNKYDILDPAIRRRFDTKYFVDIPDEDARTALLKKNLSEVKKGSKLLADEEALKSISKKLDGFSNSSICNISYQAAMNALERDRADISLQDYEKAISETTEEKPNRKEYMKDDDKKAKPIGFGSLGLKLDLKV